MQTRGYEFDAKDLIAAMDFADVSVSVLQHYPTLGDLTRLHRDACARFPTRLKRLLYLADFVRPPHTQREVDGLLARIDLELAVGLHHVVGLQFFTGWFRGEWSGEVPASQGEQKLMRSFWEGIAARGLSVYFTCVLGDPRQFGAADLELFEAEYKKVEAWCQRYTETDVVLTHGLPWRSFLEECEATGEGAETLKTLKVIHFSDLLLGAGFRTDF